MPADAAALADLVDEIGRFYIRDKKVRRAQEAMRVKLAGAGAPADADVRSYLRAVTSYFAGFEREARAHLADVDRRLAKASQLQFNLTAERGVTARRVEVTQGVLSRVAELAPR